MSSDLSSLPISFVHLVYNEHSPELSHVASTQAFGPGTEQMSPVFAFFGISMFVDDRGGIIEEKSQGVLVLPPAQESGNPTPYTSPSSSHCRENTDLAAL